MVIRGVSMVLLVLAVAGCQPKTPSEPIVVPAKQTEDVIGTYRLKSTPDEVAEAGGLEKLPTLVIEHDHWRMLVDGEESSGNWKYENGKLTLSDKVTGENSVFLSDQGGLELVLQGEDPVRFAKYGAQKPNTTDE
ncbi:MAG: hypothetical protein KF824_02585 [Fimbriimonadaceae bacterium]|nr:MAG: hypothetical protein KF824_02585 [Fimbriimonadaceae bacterium]